MNNERDNKARKDARRLAMTSWREASRLVGIDIEPPNRVDFMDGFDAGYTSRDGEVAELREALQIAFDNCTIGDLWEGELEKINAVLDKLKGTEGDC